MWNFPNNATNLSFMTFHLVFDLHIIQMAISENISSMPLKMNCFIIIERKYPNSCYNNFLIPLAVDNISFNQNIAKVLIGLFSL